VNIRPALHVEDNQEGVLSRNVGPREPDVRLDRVGELTLLDDVPNLRRGALGNGRALERWGIQKLPGQDSGERDRGRRQRETPGSRLTAVVARALGGQSVQPKDHRACQVDRQELEDQQEHPGFDHLPPQHGGCHADQAGRRRQRCRDEHANPGTGHETAALRLHQVHGAGRACRERQDERHRRELAGPDHLCGGDLLAHDQGHDRTNRHRHGERREVADQAAADQTAVAAGGTDRNIHRRLRERRNQHGCREQVGGVGEEPDPGDQPRRRSISQEAAPRPNTLQCSQEDLHRAARLDIDHLPRCLVGRRIERDDSLWQEGEPEIGNLLQRRNERFHGPVRDMHERQVPRSSGLATSQRAMFTPP
jgi:hypothetical protein